MESIPVPRPPAELPTEAELMSTWKGDLNNPLVTVVCMTYNHESFIRDALHGFLIQRTTFPFRVVVHDDASSDRTPMIIKAYEARYPRILVGIYQTENLYSRGLSKDPFVKPLVSGRYTAMCEGDDYWVDPLKMQQQVRFLDENSRYSLVYHKFLDLDQDTQAIIGVGHGPRTVTRLYRNLSSSVGPGIYANKRVVNGDVVSRFVLESMGKTKYLEEIEPAVYRHHDGGIWSKKPNLERQIEGLRTRLYIEKYIARTILERRRVRREISVRVKKLRGASPETHVLVEMELGESLTSLWSRYKWDFPFWRAFR